MGRTQRGWGGPIRQPKRNDSLRMQWNRLPGHSHRPLEGVARSVAGVGHLIQGRASCQPNSDTPAQITRVHSVWLG